LRCSSERPPESRSKVSTNSGAPRVSSMQREASVSTPSGGPTDRSLQRSASSPSPESRRTKQSRTLAGTGNVSSRSSTIRAATASSISWGESRGLVVATRAGASSSPPWTRPVVGERPSWVDGDRDSEHPATKRRPKATTAKLPRTRLTRRRLHHLDGPVNRPGPDRTWRPGHYAGGGWRGSGAQSPSSSATVIRSRLA
jgi:hypothetical protein